MENIEKEPNQTFRDEKYNMQEVKNTLNWTNCRLNITGNNKISEPEGIDTIKQKQRERGYKRHKQSNSELWGTLMQSSTRKLVFTKRREGMGQKDSLKKSWQKFFQI